MRDLSPELVLVDPVLAEEARRALPDPPDCLARSGRGEPSRAGFPGRQPLKGLWPAGQPHRNVSVGIELERPLPSVPLLGATATESESRAPRQRPSVLGILAALFVALVVGSPALDLLPFGSAQTPTLAGDPSEESDSVVLEWPGAQDATVYNVVLWRDGRRVHDFWPEQNRVDVGEAAVRSGTRLEPGTYQWFAFAGFGRRDDLRFGKRLANGTFTVE